MFMKDPMGNPMMNPRMPQIHRAGNPEQFNPEMPGGQGTPPILPGGKPPPPPYGQSGGNKRKRSGMY